MSEPLAPDLEAVRVVRARVLRVYSVVAAISVISFFLLAAYAIHLGALVGPGVESSFGLAVALMFLESALLIHVVDRVYREWPLGGRVAPDWRGAVRDQDIARFLEVLTFAAAVGAVAYIFWGVLAG